MPTQKSLRRAIKITAPTKEDLELILSGKKFTQITEPLDKRGIIVVKKDGKLIAYAQVTHYTPAGFAYIERLAVLPNYQLRGLGKKLLGEINARLISQRIYNVALQGIGKTNSFYEKTNLKPQGTGYFKATLAKKGGRRK